MRYVSTRGGATGKGFCDVLLAGLAEDGGLFMPAEWPQIPHATVAGFAGRPYAEVAGAVLRPFVQGEIDDRDLARIAADAYRTFHHPAVAPLRQLAPSLWALELFHGPTLAFKDIAMQLLSRLMDHVLSERRRRITIVGATSGDTGAAAIEAFRGSANIDVFILFPEGRVSPVQRRQMTTTGAANVHAVAVRGTFDDCQATVKALFGRPRLREQAGLAGVNSINFARILGQIVYYFTAAVALGGPRRPVSFAVPTGNFGDIFAGYAAKRMGLPVDRLVIASNVNDILTRTLATGEYKVGSVTPTSSPSMDIQVSSNFERLLFETLGRDGETVKALMDGLARSGRFTIPPEVLEAIRDDFDAARADESETAAAIRATYDATGFLADPHTAVGLAVAPRFADPEVPMIALSTAHPAKFGAAIKSALGFEPPLPAALAGVLDRPERVTTLPNDVAAVEAFLASHARAIAEKV
jgi:threonine synthase